MVSSKNTAIRFVGPPAALRACMPKLKAAEQAAAPSLRLNDRSYPVAVHSPADSGALLSLSLSERTPPGLLEAVMTFTGETYKVEIEVLEQARSVGNPPSQVLAGEPGKAVAAKVVVTNKGNMAIPFDPVDEITMRREGALGRAVRHAFTKPADFTERLIDLGANLSAEEVVTLTVTWKTPIKSLGAGKHAKVGFSLKVPGHIDETAIWSGHLPVFGTRIALSLKLTQPDNPPRPPSRKGTQV